MLFVGFAADAENVRATASASAGVGERSGRRASAAMMASGPSLSAVSAFSGSVLDHAVGHLSSAVERSEIRFDQFSDLTNQQLGREHLSTSSSRSMRVPRSRQTSDGLAELIDLVPGKPVAP